MSHTVSTIFVEFDAIFDTRAALLSTYGEEALVVNLTDEYFSRLLDKFNGIDYNEFKEKYKERNKKLLLGSATTPIVFMISDFVSSTIKNSINGPELMEPSIVINTYPYKLTDEELILIRDTFINITKGYAQISFVFMTAEDITPKYLRDNISIAIMYDYTIWLEHHSSTNMLKLIPIPTITLIAPAIFFKEPDKILIAKHSKEGLDPFKAMQELAAPFIDLKLLPIYLFSIAVKKKTE